MIYDLGRFTSLTDWLNGMYILDKYTAIVNNQNYEITEYLLDGTQCFNVRIVK